MKAIIACVLLAVPAMLASASTVRAQSWGCLVVNNTGPCNDGVGRCHAQGVSFLGASRDIAEVNAVGSCLRQAQTGTGAGSCHVVACAQNINSPEEAQALGH